MAKDRVTETGGDIPVPPTGTDQGHHPNLVEMARLFQKDEVTEHHIYQRLAGMMRDAKNASVLEKMAREELSHARFWQTLAGVEGGPDTVRVWLYVILAKLLGVTFAIKLMERSEGSTVGTYRSVSDHVPGIEEVIWDEEQHEKAIVAMLAEERLRYIGSIVLGLNDALVEFTGSLAGFTFALQDPALIAAVGSIMGIAAALSMGASEYLSQKSDRTSPRPGKAALYTGTTYILTVLILVLPFVLVKNPFLAYLVTLVFAILVIIAFTGYTSVTLDLPFGRRFAEMAALSLGIAGVSFLIGVVIRVFFGVDV
ncbi:MAG: VIT1/CCC1 transporter family protein [Methanolinea sp.]|nr:VIT1/CCC1 transporter family protein [Methanolinea sp.]